MFIFIGLVNKESNIDNKIISIKTKNSAQFPDMWHISKDGSKRYRIKAVSMKKTKDGSTILNRAQLWCFNKNDKPIYIKADKATIYKNNDIYATGNVYAKKDDINIYAKDAHWYNIKKILQSSLPFRGFSKKSKFKGKKFVYSSGNSKLTVYGVNIWIE